MASLLDITKSKVYRVLHLTCYACFVYMNICGIIAPVTGFNYVHIGSFLSAKSNNTIEIAVSLPFEIPPGFNECCSSNGSYCNKFGSHCLCQQRDNECRCICPSENVFPGGSHFNFDDCCQSNSTYCSRRYGPDCACQQEDTTCSCVCTPAYDYTVRLAAGIAIILLIAVSVMLAISLYRRAVLSRRQRQRRHNSEVSLSTVPDPPPDYADINTISSPCAYTSSDFEKLPTYEEALTLQKMAQAESKSDLESLATDKGQIEVPVTSENCSTVAQSTNPVLITHESETGIVLTVKSSNMNYSVEQEETTVL